MWTVTDSSDSSRFFQKMKINNRDKYRQVCCWLSSVNRQILIDDVRNGNNSPLVSVLVATYKTPITTLSTMIRSVLAQTYKNWELCIVDDGSSSTKVAEILSLFAQQEPRIRIQLRESNGGISVANNDALRMAKGQYVAFLDHDDELTPQALDLCIEQLLLEGSDVVYSDQDTVDELNNVLHTFHKPKWSPEYFRHVMYVGHLLVVRRSLAVKVGGFLTRYDGVQDFEFMLRLSEITQKISHVPKVLYHWRAIDGSLASATDAKKGISGLQARAVQEHLDRLGIDAMATPHPRIAHRCRIQPRLSQYPKISIVIPTKDQPQLIATCLGSIFKKSTYPNYEVVVVDTGTTDPDAIKIIDSYPVLVNRFSGEFNFSAACNNGAAAASGEILVFLNNDTEVITEDWMEHIVLHFSSRDVGVVGPLLLYPDGSVQHAGVVIGARGTADHVMRHFSADSDGYSGSLSSPREVSAVTGACLAIRTGTFSEVGGFNTMYGIHYQDVDLCLKVRQRSMRCIFTPEAQLFHHESPTRGSKYDFLDRLLLIDTWVDMLAAGDPYYSSHFSIEKLDYSLA
jgi:glycosyltransferase involved in cell wall biosynthesis